MKPRTQELRVWLIAVLAVLAWSGLNPKDRFTWFLEVAPVFIGIPLLALSYRTFPLTSLTYRLLTIHAGILMIGGHYTYAEVPIGYWLQDLFGFARNHYDRLGHIAQGFIHRRERNPSSLFSSGTRQMDILSCYRRMPSLQCLV